MNIIVKIIYSMYSVIIYSVTNKKNYFLGLRRRVI